MYKLLKWEIRSKYKFVLATLGILLAFNLWLLTMLRASDREGVLFAVSVVAAFTAMVVIAIDSSRMFTKSLKRDCKYLLFSIPRSGYQRIGANLIMAAIKMLVVIIFGGLLSLINGLFYMMVWGDKEYGHVFDIIWKLKFEIFLTIIVILGAYIAFLVLIYFSKIICKAVLKDIKFSGLITFLFFIATSSIITEVLSFLVNTFNYYFKIKLFTSVEETANSMVTYHMRAVYSAIGVNIVGIIFFVMTVVLMFLAAAYVLDKNVDV